MSDDPTEAEIKSLLEQLECCLVASKHAAPESFRLVWQDQLDKFAREMEVVDRNVFILRQQPGHDGTLETGLLAWMQVVPDRLCPSTMIQKPARIGTMLSFSGGYMMFLDYRPAQLSW